MNSLPGVDQICQVELLLDAEKQAILLADVGRFLIHWEAEANEILVFPNVGSDRKIKDMAENYLNVGYDDGHGDKVIRGKLLWDTNLEERLSTERSPKPSFPKMLLWVTTLFTKLIQDRTNTSTEREQQDDDRNAYDGISDEDDGLPDIDMMMQHTPSKHRRPIQDEAKDLPAGGLTASGGTVRAEQHNASHFTASALTDGLEPQTPVRSIGERSMAKRTGDSVSRNPRHSGGKKKNAHPDPTTKVSKEKKSIHQGRQPVVEPSVRTLGPRNDGDISLRRADAHDRPSQANEHEDPRLPSAKSLRSDSTPSNPFCNGSSVPICGSKRRAPVPQLPLWDEILDGRTQRLSDASSRSKAGPKNDIGEDRTRNDENNPANEPLAKRQKLFTSSSNSRDHKNDNEMHRPHQHPAESYTIIDGALISPSLHLETEKTSPDTSRSSDVEIALYLNGNHATSTVTCHQNAQTDIETPSPNRGRSPTLVPSSCVGNILGFTVESGNTMQEATSEDKTEGITPALGTADVIEAEQRPLEDEADHASPDDAARTVLPARISNCPPLVFFVLQNNHPYKTWHYWKEAHSRSRSLEAVFEAVSKYSLLPLSDELEFTLHFADKVWTFGAMRHDDKDYSCLRDLMIDAAIKYPHEDGQADSSIRFYVSPA